VPSTTPAVRALADEPDEHEGATSERILDATVQEAATTGLRRLAIEDVARRARTSRVTVYRHFGRREQLIEAMAVRETRRFIAAMREAVSSSDELEEQGAEVFVAGLRFMHEHPVARRAIESEPEAIVQYLEQDDGLLFRMSREFVASWLRGAGIEHPDVDAAAETIARLFVSFLLLPQSVVQLDDDDATRAYVRTCIAPIVASAARYRAR
jgi:AcrR family transcriptional regulator